MAPAVTLRWSKRSKAHLQAAWEFIARDNAKAADELIERILDAAEALERHPHMGRAGRIQGTRELVIPSTPFILTYRTERQMITVLALFHGARRWPEQF